MTEKTVISQVEFKKKVEIESAYLIYMDRLPKNVADKQAHETISKKFEVSRM